MDHPANMPPPPDSPMELAPLPSGRTATAISWLETVILTALGPLANFALDSADPFLIASGFPWLVLAPMLIGLRHGLGCSIASAALLATGAFLGWREGLVQLAAFPGAFVTGLLIVALISSEYRAHWHRQLERLTKHGEYNRARLEQFAKTYHLMKVSHDNLEQQISGNTRSIRGALSDLYKRLLSLEAAQNQQFRGSSGTVLQLFADYGMLQIAALYEMAPDGSIKPEPAACVGKPRPIKPDEPLVLAAIRNKRAVAISPHLEPQGSSTIMAVVPIVDLLGEIHGLVTIDELPFIALQAPNLKLLSVFGGHIGDCLLRWSDVRTDASNELSRFRADLQRSVLDARECDIPAVLIAVSLGPSWAQREFLEEIMMNCRGLDRLWVSKNQAEGISVLKLLPGTDQIGAERYIWRLDRMVKAHLGVPLSSEGLAIKMENIDGRANAEEVLGRFMKFFASAKCDTSAAHRLAHGALTLKEQKWSLYSS